MNRLVDQVSQDEVIGRQQQADRRLMVDRRRPASFREYLETMSGGSVSRREGLAELAERARRAPRIG